MAPISSKKTIDNLKGPQGRSKRIDCFLRQTLIRGNREIAELLADKAIVMQARANKSPFIKQGADDSDLYFILSGRVAVTSNGRHVTYRERDTYVGEMTLIDTMTRRSAAVHAVEPTILARVSEEDFTEIADKHPLLWRTLAMGVADQLRQRLADLPEKHSQPVVFIGSASEELCIAREIQTGLSKDQCVPRVWTDGTFQPTQSSLSSMLDQVRQSDFGVLIVTPIDKGRSRGNDVKVPRDNILLELGLFLGHLGPKRTFLVSPASPPVKLPSDLAGIEPIKYAIGPTNTLSSRIAPVCNEIRKKIMELGSF